MKVFDWNNFMETTAVHCKYYWEALDFLKNAGLHGVLKPGNTYLESVKSFDKFFGDTCYRLDCSGRIICGEKSHYALHYQILEWSDYMFAKEDLKVGMLIETSRGRALVMPYTGGYGLAYYGGGFERWCDLQIGSVRTIWDVCSNGRYFLDFTGNFRDVLYTRKPTKEMTLEQISKALGCNVKIVKG